jgi:hypothetical protein
MILWRQMFLGFGIIFFSDDIQRYVSNDQVYDKLSGKKETDKECKHLSNFTSVWALY